ncbi:MAG: nucleoside transporter C-terminal domain-containing protein, partial [Thermodesulfovibrionales bacterium]
MTIIRGLTGILSLIAIAWLFSENRKATSLKLIIVGIVMQIILALLLIKVGFINNLFLLLNDLVMSLEKATTAGTSFVFGYLGGGPLPFDEKYPGSSFVLAIRALPLILVVSALSSLLFYWRILPYIVRRFSFIFEKTMTIGGALGLGASANIFVGMVESPLFIRPYLKEMTRSELFSVMTCGMATIAGTVMVLYASTLKHAIPGAMGHILTASLISAPAALTISRIMVPETGKHTSGDLIPPRPANSSMDAVTKGTLDGLQLLLNITAMLIVLVALVSLANQFLGLFPDFADQPVTLQRILGYIFSPVMWLIGIPWHEAKTAGS